MSFNAPNLPELIREIEEIINQIKLEEQTKPEP
jgi:hypothetical protein